jgi:acetyl-CoA decarbonylase/synthase complex subunit delta
MQLGPQWAPRELRGPLWEAITAETLLLAGVDYFMMMHPASVKAIRMMIDNLMARRRPEKSIEWVGLRI